MCQKNKMDSFFERYTETRNEVKLRTMLMVGHCRPRQNVGKTEAHRFKIVSVQSSIMDETLTAHSAAFHLI
jgi:hypothetical protein